MELKETMLERQDIFRGKILTLHVDKVSLMDGKTTYREIVDHPGGVGIVALDEQDRVAIVTQYRYAFGREMVEIPAGKREPKEAPLTTAQRELLEEVGAIAAKWTDLGALIPSPGCYGETLYLFLAQELTFTQAQPDEGEFLTARMVPFDTLYRQCMAGEIQDAKTVAAVLKVKLLLGL